MVVFFPFSHNSFFLCDVVAAFPVVTTFLLTIRVGSVFVSLVDVVDVVADHVSYKPCSCSEVRVSFYELVYMFCQFDWDFYGCIVVLSLISHFVPTSVFLSVFLWFSFFSKNIYSYQYCILYSIMNARRPEQDEYTPVKIPHSMIEQIDRYMQDNPEFDFKTRPQFIKYLIRRYMDEHKK